MALDPTFEKIGTLEAPASNAPFSLRDAGSVWIVERGRLDLFLVSGLNGRPTGARYPVMRVEEGEAVFGVGENIAANAQLIASAFPDTKLLRIPSTLFRELASLAGDAHARLLLENWINRLSSVVSGSQPANLVAIDPGDPFSPGGSADGARGIVARDRVVWVAQRNGTSRFLGRESVASGPDHFFPVSRYGWLEVAPDSVLSCVDSQTCFRLDSEGRALQAFHAMALSLLVQKQQAEHEEERKRQRTKNAADKTLLHGVFLRLATPLRGASSLEEGEETIADPIFLAAQAVGNKMGIKLKPHPDMLRGMKFADPVAAIARASNVRTRQVQLRGEWWKQDVGPLLAFRDTDHRPVALLPRSATAYDVYDPVDLTTLPVTEQTNFTLSTFAYMFYRPFAAKDLDLADVLKLGIGEWKNEVVTIVLMGAAAGLMGIVTPYATGLIFDRLIPGAERSQLVQMALILLVIAIAGSMFTLIRSFAVLRLQGKIDKGLQAAVWDRLLSLPVPFFRSYTSGDLASRSLAIAEMSRILTGSLLSAILSGIFSVFSWGLLFYYSGELALLATALVFFACAVSAACVYLQVRYQREFFRLSGRISGLLLELVTGIAKLRVAGAEHRAFASWAREFSAKKQISTRARQVSNGLTVFNSVFPVISLAAIFYCVAVIQERSLSHPMSTGDFVAFIAAFSQFLGGALLVSSSLMSVLGIVPLYERAKPIFQTLPETAAGKASPGKLAGAIELSHVTFRYRPDTPLVIQDLSVEILPGQFVAFVGVSGGGKSTLFRLLLGFETPESGTVYFDRQDLAGLDVQAVRRQMGVVLQTSRLISGDIFTNIVGSSPLTIDDAWEAATLAGMDEDIKRMPMGMHTIIGEGGGSISGGQRQRLMIARAIVGRPRILLMDEATSSLDNQTQAIVSRNLERLRATRIVIAHRLSTIAHADRVFVVDKGTVVQAGTYEELRNQKGVFRDLVSRQLA
ncbi:MAG: NHLP bacteriocin export ABC transporter permease/ATPase subunit [Terriglobales bacterium]